MAESGWKDIGRSAGAGKQNRDWQQAAPQEPGSPKGLSRNAKRIIAVAALGLLCLAVGVVVKWLTPFRSCLVVIGSGYEKNLFVPHNVHGWHGLANLDALARPEPAVRFSWQQPEGIRRVGGPREMTAENTWADIWRDVSRNLASTHEKSVVIVVSLHGYADKDDAFLLANDPNPQRLFDSQQKSRVSFQEVLDSLAQLKKRQIVLLLDVCQLSSHWPSGLLQNDFVGRLRDKYENKIDAMGNLIVICAADSKQRAWVSDEWQSSMFLHYVKQVLRGVEPGRVSAARLFDYVSGKVNQLALSNRARNQSPVLLGKKGLAETIEFAQFDTAAVEETPEEAPGFAVDHSAELRGEWNQWLELRKLAPFAYSPHRWRLYQETLLRLEQLVCAGDPTSQAADLKDQLGKLREEIRSARMLTRARPTLPFSLPMAAVMGLEQAPDPDLLKRCKEYDKAAEEQRKVLLQTWREGHSAEGHLLKMLCHDKHPALPADLVTQAVATRILAEQTALSAFKPEAHHPQEAQAKANPPAYLYSEVIFPWIKNDVDAADETRRLGEDWLFGQSKEHFDRARAKLDEARTAYEAAMKRGVAAREALAIYDEVCGDVFHMGLWLAGTPPSSNSRAETQDNFAGLPELGIQLNQLRGGLDMPALPPWLTQRTTEIRDMHAGIRKKYHKLAADFTPVLFQRNWHELDNALSVPPLDLDVDLRLDLLRKRHVVAAGLLQKVQKIEPEPQDPAETARLKIALQASLEPFDLRVTAQPFDEALGQSLLKLPQKINANATGFPAQQVKDASQLIAAANWCRMVPPGLSEQVQAVPLHPVEWLRRQRMQELLYWQAERTWRDHWFEPGKPGQEEPYYRPAAEAYLQSAFDLIKEQERADEPNRNLVAQLKQKLDDFAAEKLRPSQRLKGTEKGEEFWLSTHRSFPLRWSIQAEDKQPPGPAQPLCWIDTQERQPLPWPQKSSIDFRLQADAQGKPLKQAMLHAVFRGQHLMDRVKFRPAVPDVIVRDIPAVQSAIAVRMDAQFDYGAISILLDNSGSMLWVPGEDRYPKKGEKPRFEFAIEALETVLAQIPERTSLSVLVFSSTREGDDKEVGGTGVDFFRGDKQARVWQNVAVNREARLELVEEFRRKLKRAELYRAQAERDKKKRLTEPWFYNSSPIARGILKCKQQGFPRDFKEPQVVIALTDGMDNCSFVELNEKPGGGYDRLQVEASENSIKNNLGYGKSDNIDTLLVCMMDKKNAEYQVVKSQFDWLDNSRGKSAFRQRSDPREIGKTILDILRPRLKLRDDRKQLVTRLDDDGHVIDMPGDATWIRLPPGTYFSELPRVNHDSQKITLTPAQNLLLVLKRNYREFFLERDLLYRHAEVPEKFSINRGDWQVTLFGHNVSSGTRELDELVIFENRNTGPGDVAMPRPGFVWLEMSAEKDGKPIRTDVVEWKNEPNVAAPGHRLNVANWPDGAQPKLTAWFSRDEILPADLVRSAPLYLGGLDDFKLPGIDSVAWERHKDKNVLVVQGRFPRNQPLMARLEILDATRAPNVEHFYFNDVGRFTTYFHGLPSNFKANLVVVDVGLFKRKTDQDKVSFTPDAATTVTPWNGSVLP